MIAKRIRRGTRAARGSVRKLHRFIDALTRYLVNAEAADLVAIETGRRLTAYILDANGTSMLELGVERGEKVLYSDARNLIGDGFESRQVQMLATAARAAMCHDPIEHYVLSWQAGEEPGTQQFERAVEIAVNELGLRECQAIWAAHGNTNNHHVHIAVNRVHPITGKTISTGDGWDKDRLQQVCALIEHEQGWRAETKAKYAVRDGEVVHRETGTVVRDCHGRQTRARDRAAEPPVFPEDFEPVVEAIAHARDWHDLHDRMHRLNARYVRAGPGAKVVRGEVQIKPSKLGRHCSLPELQKRFGPFEPSRHLQGYPRYKAQCDQTRDKLKAAEDAAKASVEGWYLAQASGLAPFAGSEFGEALAGDLSARRDAILSSIGSAFGAAQAAIGTIGSERAWIAAGTPEPQVVPAPAVLLPSLMSRPVETIVESDLLATFEKRINRKSGLVEYRDRAGEIVMVDAGGTVIVHRTQRAELEAGLLLAAGRWSEIKFTGDAQTAEIVTELALRHRVRVLDADGRPLLAKTHFGAVQKWEALADAVPSEPAAPSHGQTRDIRVSDTQEQSQPDLDATSSQTQMDVDDDGPDIVGHTLRGKRGHSR